MNDDATLLLRYARDHSEDAFAELVRRHVDLVYSAALRRCSGDTHRAEDVVQHVFTSLASNAKKLANHPALGAWLYSATRNAVINLAVAEQRRARREKEAVMSGFLSAENDSPDWSEIRPVLDEVMDELSESDRTAVLLRFFQQRSFSEIGAAQSVSENAARMRTERALEKLRFLLQRRGVRSASTALGLMLTRQAVVAAPPGFAAVVTSAILGIEIGVVASGGFSAWLAARKAGLGLGLLTVFVMVVGGLEYARHRPAPADGLQPTIERGTPVPIEAGWVLSAEKSNTQREPAASTTAGELKQEAGAPSIVADPRAEEILKKMAAAYTALTAYRDSGEVLEKNPGKTVVSDIRFLTLFRQPGRIAFSFNQRSFEWVTTISSVGGRATVYWSIDPTHTTTTDYGTAIVSEIARSRGSSFHVPRFFSADAGKLFSVAMLKGSQLVGEAAIEGTPCYLVKGMHPNGSPYELWIGRDDFLVRKIRTVALAPFLISMVRPPGPDSSYEEIHRNIRINGDVSGTLK